MFSFRVQAIDGEKEKKKKKGRGKKVGKKKGPKGKKEKKMKDLTPERFHHRFNHLFCYLPKQKKATCRFNAHSRKCVHVHVAYMYTVGLSATETR